MPVGSSCSMFLLSLQALTCCMPIRRKSRISSICTIEATPRNPLINPTRHRGEHQGRKPQHQGHSQCYLQAFPTAERLISASPPLNDAPTQPAVLKKGKRKRVQNEFKPQDCHIRYQSIGSKFWESSVIPVENQHEWPMCRPSRPAFGRKCWRAQDPSMISCAVLLNKQVSGSNHEVLLGGSTKKFTSWSHSRWQGLTEAAIQMGGNLQALALLL